MSYPLRSVVLAGGLAGAMAAGAAEAQTTLRWGHYLPDSAFLQVEKDFAAAVEERTEGRVEIEITYAGGLGAGNELLTLTGRGAIDMAAIVPGYYADQLLFWRAYQIPFVFDTPRQAMEISAEAYEELPYFEDELDRFGVKFLFHQPLGAYYLTGPDPQCATVEALEGKKIRSFGADIPKAVEAIGAVPVTVGIGEVYEALQRGALDYSFLNRGNILTNRLYEAGATSCGPVMAITGHLIVIGQRQWDGLSPQDQAIILEEAEEAGRTYIDAMDTAEDEAGAAIVEAGGEIVPFPDAELQRWKDAAPDLLQDWVDDMEARGLGTEAEEVAKYWRERIEG
ncbi:C4-dicarboxylate TRAP transporter substrate-binding protein [Acuticoccus sp.]|uniref:C4-dicarboxylate TRAP transporter substrate-binding protein n=1 Tax=Acuticoccus sp. TaxID=1904378 RepID=UPI003B51CB60